MRIEVRILRGIVVVVQLLAYASIAHADHIARGKVHQSRLTALPQEAEQVHSGIDVRCQGFAQIGIEVGQPRAVDYQV